MKLKNLSCFICLFFCLNTFCQTHQVTYESLVSKADTFIINQKKFRIRVYDTIKNSLVIERLDSKWLIVNIIENGGDVFYKDINKDGFVDIGIIDEPIADVFFYYPDKEIFIQSGVYSENEFKDDGEKMQLIDKTNNIYFDYQPYKRNSTSYLFQIKNYQRIELGNILQESKFVETGKGEVRQLSISIEKIIRSDKTLLVQKMRQVGNKDFDYAAYWKLNWRKFLRN